MSKQLATQVHFLSTFSSEHVRIVPNCVVVQPWCHVSSKCYKVPGKNKEQDYELLYFGYNSLIDCTQYPSLDIQNRISWQRAFCESGKYKCNKITNILKLSQAQWPKSYSIFQDRFHLEWALPGSVELSIVISRGLIQKINAWVLPALLQKLMKWGVSL